MAATRALFGRTSDQAASNRTWHLAHGCLRGARRWHIMCFGWHTLMPSPAGGRKEPLLPLSTHPIGITSGWTIWVEDDKDKHAAPRTLGRANRPGGTCHHRALVRQHFMACVSMARRTQHLRSPCAAKLPASTISLNARHAFARRLPPGHSPRRGPASSRNSTFGLPMHVS